MTGRRAHRTMLLGGLALALLSASGASAQCPKYRVVDLGSLAAGFGSEAWALNDLGQVVGHANTGPGVFHAFFWDNAGCVGNCMRDLGALTVGPTSQARDINNLSQIVGFSDTVNGGPSLVRATWWETSTAAPVDLGTLSGNSLDSSEAHGINDSSLVVGWSDTNVDCQDHELITVDRAFKKSGAAGTMAEIGAPEGGFSGVLNRDSIAYAVNNNVPPPAGLLFVYAGVGSPCGDSPQPCSGPEESRDAMAWIGANDDAHDLPPPPGFTDAFAEALDVNDQDQLVGWQAAEVGSCLTRAMFWPTVALSPADLHGLTSIPQNKQTVAEAMNEHGQVVGQNTTDQLAYLWTFDSLQNQWHVLDLNVEMSACAAEDWDLKDARDINECGWIVGKGEFLGGTRAFLLLPITTCLWDIDGLGSVDTVDMLALLQAWGPCNPPNGICLADFDCNAIIDTVDFLDLLAHWGSCNAFCPPSGDAPYCQNSGEASSGSPGGGSTSGSAGGEATPVSAGVEEPSVADVERAIMILGFPDLVGFGAWMDAASDSEAAVVIETLAALLLP